VCTASEFLPAYYQIGTGVVSQGVSCRWMKLNAHPTSSAEVRKSRAIPLFPPPQGFHCVLEAIWNVMVHAQKPDFVFRRNGLVHLNRQGRQFSRLLATEVCASAFIVGSNAGCTMFRGSVKSTGYPLHSSVSPSLPLPCVTVCHHFSTGLSSKTLLFMYNILWPHNFRDTNHLVRNPEYYRLH
jgi:hypothetical protein